MRLIANARMYAVDAATAANWTALFARIAVMAGVPLTVIPHAAPAPLEDLWRRDDLGLAFICGYPFARGGFPVQPVAAPSWAARTAGASRAVSAWRRRGQRAAAAQRSLSAPMRLGRSYSRRGVAKHTDLLSHQYLQNACLSKGPCTIWKSSGRPSTATRSSYKR